MKLLAVAVLVFALISAENVFAIQIAMHPTCGQPPPVEFTVTDLWGYAYSQIITWGSGWEQFELICPETGVVRTCTISNIGTTGGFKVTFFLLDDSSFASATYTVDCPAAAVGGVVTPVNTFAVLAPWVAVVGLVGCVGAAVVVAKKRRP